MFSLVTALIAYSLARVARPEKRVGSAFACGVVSVVAFLIGCGGGGGITVPGGGGQSSLTPTSNAKVPAGAPFLITATITSSKPLTGTVTFSNFGTPFAGGFPPVNVQAQTGQGYINNPGLYQITASYSGDSNNLPSTSAPLSQVLTGTFPVLIQGARGGDIHSLQATLGVQ